MCYNPFKKKQTFREKMVDKYGQEAADAPTYLGPPSHFPKGSDEDNMWREKYNRLVDPLTGKGVEYYTPPPDPFGLLGPRIQTSSVTDVKPGEKGRRTRVSDLRIGG